MPGAATTRTLDLECETEAERDEWVTAFEFLLQWQGTPPKIEQVGGGGEFRLIDMFVCFVLFALLPVDYSIFMVVVFFFFD